MMFLLQRFHLIPLWAILLAQLLPEKPFVSSFLPLPSRSTLPSLWKQHQHLDASTKQQEPQNEVNDEANQLLEKAQKLREEIARVEKEQEQQGQRPNKSENQGIVAPAKLSPFSLPPLATEENNNTSPCYRLYFDLGREPGTWMPNTWGVSGQRFEFTLDIRFRPDQKASQEVQQTMVQDNVGGQRSPVYIVETAPYARLRQGFDQMACGPGGYRIDTGSRGVSNVPFLCFHPRGKESRGHSTDG